MIHIIEKKTAQKNEQTLFYLSFKFGGMGAGYWVVHIIYTNMEL